MDRIDNIKFLTELCIQKIIGFIVEDEHIECHEFLSPTMGSYIEYDDALHKFYLSETFQKLNDSTTGLYRESAAYIYEIFKSEIKHGKII